MSSVKLTHSFRNRTTSSSRLEYISLFTILPVSHRGYKIYQAMCKFHCQGCMRQVCKLRVSLAPLPELLLFSSRRQIDILPADFYYKNQSVSSTHLTEIRRDSIFGGETNIKSIVGIRSMLGIKAQLAPFKGISRRDSCICSHQLLGMMRSS